MSSLADIFGQIEDKTVLTGIFLVCFGVYVIFPTPELLSMVTLVLGALVMVLKAGAEKVLVVTTEETAMKILEGFKDA